MLNIELRLENSAHLDDPDCRLTGDSRQDSIRPTNLSQWFTAPL